MPEREILPTATNVQVHSYTSHDIVLSILSKLSLKSFKRFESVCKSWSLLFDDPYFMNIYRKSFLAKDSSYYDDTSLFLYLSGEFGELGEDSRQHQYSNHLYSISGERFENKVKLEFPKPFLKRSPPFTLNHYGLEILVSGSINGILCLHYRYKGFQKLIVWNPTTNERNDIPKGRKASRSSSYIWMDSYDHHLVGYDRFKNDYKVVRIMFGISPYPQMPHISCEMYSLRRNSWKKMDDHLPGFYTINHEVYMNGVSHWWDETRDKIGSHINLFSFDFSTESFIITSIPSYIDDCLDSVHGYKVTRRLVILNGSIAFIINYIKMSTIHISILGEIGVKESWIKLFVVTISPYLKYPVGAGKNGKIFFKTEDRKLVCFDLSSGMFDEMGIRGPSFSCNMLFHRKSILPIRGT